MIALTVNKRAAVILRLSDEDRRRTSIRASPTLDVWSANLSDFDCKLSPVNFLCR